MTVRRNLRIRIGIGGVLAVIMALTAGQARAYTEEIAAPRVEVFQAAQQVFEPEGVRNAGSSQSWVESRWIEDAVTRERKLLFIKKTLKKNMARRFRMKIELADKEDRTQVKISGKFQERPLESRPQAPWRNVKRTPEEYSIERDYFFKILRQIEINRALGTDKPPVETPSA